MNKKKASKLKNTPFPECVKDCKAVEMLGAGECANVCPQKFYTAKALEEYINSLYTKEQVIKLCLKAFEDSCKYGSFNNFVITEINK